MNEEESKTNPVYPAPPAYYLDESFTENDSPPKPPNDGKYRCFGETRDLQEVTPSLDSMGYKTLYDVNGKPKTELMNLVRESSQRFLSLIGSLEADASSEKIKQDIADLNMVYVNLLYLVNEMRTKQAKAELVRMLRDQVEAKNAAADRLVELEKSVQRDIVSIFNSFATEENGDVVMALTEMKHDDGSTTANSVTVADIIDEELALLRR